MIANKQNFSYHFLETGRLQSSKERRGCRYVRDEFNGDGDCEYNTSILCEECKYSGLGRKNPEAKINQR